MKFRTAALAGSASFLTLITGLQLWLNPAARTQPQSFRVGFLPVT